MIFPLIQTTADESTSIGNKAKITLLSQIIGSEFRYANEVYNLKLSFYGQNADPWLNYFVYALGFTKVGSAGEEQFMVEYAPPPGLPIKLILSHSIIKVSVTEVT